MAKLKKNRMLTKKELLAVLSYVIKVEEPIPPKQQTADGLFTILISTIKKPPPPPPEP